MWKQSGKSAEADGAEAGEKLPAVFQANNAFIELNCVFFQYNAFKSNHGYVLPMFDGAVSGDFKGSANRHGSRAINGVLAMEVSNASPARQSPVKVTQARFCKCARFGFKSIAVAGLRFVGPTTAIWGRAGRRRTLPKMPLRRCAKPTHRASFLPDGREVFRWPCGRRQGG